MFNYVQYAFITLLLDYQLFGLTQQSNYQRINLWMFESIKNIKAIISNFWSASPNANNANNAWKVNFNNGNDNNNRNNSNRVRLVRFGE